jgi:hypothetical protein
MIFSENRLPLFRIMRKGVADDAGEPFVEIVLLLRLLGLMHLDRGIAGQEFGLTAIARQI